MRYPAERKEQTHSRIIAAAARSFRENGVDANGIASVMNELGLTKGGFYRHFDSKGDLMAQAVETAFEQIGDSMIEVAKSAPPGRALRAMIERYLSAEHAGNPGHGCVIAALGPELARQPPDIRSRISNSFATYRDRLLPFLPGRTLKQKRERFGILFPAMAGVLTISRTIDDPDARDAYLRSARNFFIDSFAPDSTQ